MKWILVKRITDNLIFQIYYDETNNKPEIPVDCVLISEGEDICQEDIVD